METKKILAADLLDLLFENRNKEYGAYELRKTYNKRITTALIVTASVTIVALGSFYFANSSGGTTTGRFKVDSLTLIDIQPEEKIAPPPPPPPPRVEPPPVASIQFTTPKIVDDKQVDPDEVPPQVEELETNRIDLITQAGAEDDGLAKPIDQGRQVIVEKKVEDDNEIVRIVEIEASFPGGETAWKRFLERHLNPNAPVDNGAPAGRYQVWVQFVVDKEGVISDVKALTAHGYGMEDEAVKIIKKGPQWIPAIQNGHKVKAYRKQSIVFVVESE